MADFKKQRPVRNPCAPEPFRGNLMSNPWKNSPLDTSGEPLRYLLSSLHYVAPSENHSESFRVAKAISTGEESDLVARLRDADEAIGAMRKSRLKNKSDKMHADLHAAANLLNELNLVFYSLSEYFQLFQQGDLLRLSYENALYMNFAIKDDFSSENKAKIVQMIRAAIEIINKLKQNESGPPLKIREDTLKRLLGETRIMEVGKDAESYMMDELSDVIEECNVQLKTIKMVKFGV